MADTHPAIQNSVHRRRWGDDNSLGWLTKIAIEINLAAAAVVTQVASSPKGQLNIIWVKISISAMLIALSASLASALLSSVYFRTIRILVHVGMLFSVLAITSLISIAVIGEFKWASLVPCLVPLASLSRELYSILTTTLPISFKRAVEANVAVDVNSTTSMVAGAYGGPSTPAGALEASVSGQTMSISVMNGDSQQHGVPTGADGGAEAGSSAAYMEAFPNSSQSTSSCNLEANMISQSNSSSALVSILPKVSSLHSETCLSAGVVEGGAEEIDIVVETNALPQHQLGSFSS